MWTPGLSEARQASEGPLESGATLVYTGTFLGLALRVDGRVHRPGREQAVRHQDHRRAVRPGGGHYPGAVARRDQGAEYLPGESRGFYKLAEPLVVRLTRKQTEAAYDNLRTLLEEGAL